MRFLFGFISLFFIYSCTEKTEKKTLSLCKAGVDYLLQASQIEYEADGYIKGVGYVDGHCLDSGKALFLYNDVRTYTMRDENFKYGYQVLEYGNFKNGYYEVDSVVLPLFGFQIFENRQQIVLKNLQEHWNPRFENLYGGAGALRIIYPYKDKLFILTNWNILVVDIQEKSVRYLVSFALSIPTGRKFKNEAIYNSMYLDSMRIKNDTIVVFSGPSSTKYNSELYATLLITLDGKKVFPKISNNLCLRIMLRTEEMKYFGNMERCFEELKEQE
jgi:hypothetical protein